MSVLAFTVYDNFLVSQSNLQNVSQRQPFGNQAYHEEMVGFWKQKFEQLASAINPAAMNAALEQYEQAIQFDGSDRWLRLNYARLLLDGRKDRAAAAEQYRVIIERLPQDFTSLGDLATLEMMMGNPGMSLEHAVRAVKCMPSSAIANYTAGAAYQMLGRDEEAIRHFNCAIKWNPKLVLAYTRLGQIFGKHGEIGRAEKVYRKGIEAVPNNAQLHMNMALLLKDKGLFTESEQERQKAISLDPNIAVRAGRR